MMNQKQKDDVLTRLSDTVRQLSGDQSRFEYIPQQEVRLPDVQKLRELVEHVKHIVFPGYFNEAGIGEATRGYYIGVEVERLFLLLKEQIGLGLHSFQPDIPDGVKAAAANKTLAFIDALPELKRMLNTDVKAVYDGDPAAKSFEEIIFCYPAILAVIHYRVAHLLLQLGVPVIPRIITEMAHSQTGIDIHPGAQIGEYFSIDHGTGIVIGETCIIGSHVRLYQGVTLGAKSFKYDDEGNILNVPRHPILEDYVTVYSNASILGRITIGHHSVVGGNIWQTESVPPYSQVVQRKAQSMQLMDGAGI